MELTDRLYPKRYENPKTLSGKICWSIERTVHNIKHTILRNKTSEELIFILLYFLEQGFFLYLILNHKKFNVNVTTISSFFVLVLLTTMAIERVLMKLRLTTLNILINKLVGMNLKSSNIIKKLIKKQK